MVFRHPSLLHGSQSVGIARVRREVEVRLHAVSESMLFATGDNHPLVVHVSQMKEEVQRQIRNWHRLIVVFRLRRTLVSKMADQQWNRNLLSKIVDLLHWRRRDDVVRVVRNLLAY